MKQLTILFALFFAITVSAQSNGEVWRYDDSSGKWFQPAPSMPDKVQKAKGKEVKKHEKKMKSSNDDGSCEECEKDYTLPEANTDSVSKPSQQSKTMLYTPQIKRSAKTVIYTDSNIITKAYKPWNVYGLLRTNLIGDVALIPNVGGEITVGKNWSLGADFYLQWLKDRGKDKFYQTYMLDVDTRYWWGKQHKVRPLTGWHAGIYGQAVTFDLENGNKGYQSRVFFWTFGIGSEIGYNKSISKRLGLDFYIGIGYLHTKYNVYHPGHNREYYFDHRECRNFFGPTRIGLSLNYLIK